MSEIVDSVDTDLTINPNSVNIPRISSTNSNASSNMLPTQSSGRLSKNASPDVTLEIENASSAQNLEIESVNNIGPLSESNLNNNSSSNNNNNNNTNIPRNRSKNNSVNNSKNVSRQNSNSNSISSSHAGSSTLKSSNLKPSFSGALGLSNLATKSETSNPWGNPDQKNLSGLTQLKPLSKLSLTSDTNATGPKKTAAALFSSASGNNANSAPTVASKLKALNDSSKAMPMPVSLPPLEKPEDKKLNGGSNAPAPIKNAWGTPAQNNNVTVSSILTQQNSAKYDLRNQKMTAAQLLQGGNKGRMPMNFGPTHIVIF